MCEDWAEAASLRKRALGCVRREGLSDTED